MSCDNVYERLWKLQASVNALVLNGKRDPEKIAEIYQAILQGSGRREVTITRTIDGAGREETNDG